MAKILYTTFLDQARKISNNHNVNKIILAKFLNQSLNWLYTNLNSFGNQKSLNNYLKLIKKYADGYPLGYILGFVEFYRCQIIVNKNVLIPRNETEQLVERVLELTKIIFQQSKINLLDLATGSGCIAVAIANNQKNWKITATDVSKKALLVAQKNIKLNQINNVTLKQSNLFQKLINQKFDVIISNPPYINFEKDSYEFRQLQHEPELALFAGNDGLYFYQLILAKVKFFCNEKFLIALEIGNKQKAAITKILYNNGWKKSQFWFEKDYQQQWRFLFLINAILP